jgi:hypothetical protein
MWPIVGMARSADVATRPEKPGAGGRTPLSESLHRATPGRLGEAGSESPGAAGGDELLLFTPPA